MGITDFLRKHTPLSAEVEGIIESRSSGEVFQKNATVLRTDNLSKKIFFLESGLARVYYAKDGKDITLYFLEAGNFSLPVDSIFYGTVCKYGIQALEKSKVLSLKYNDWEQAMLTCPALESFCRKLLIAYVKKANDKLYGLQFQPARERFELMQQQYPDILVRAPLGDIASYLGITQETLSRLRAGK